MPDLEANCSLDLGCPVDEFSAFCDAHPDRTVVVYANTSAAVKARADWMVTVAARWTSCSTCKDQGKKILWAPDRHLGGYIQRADRRRHADVARLLHRARRIQGASSWKLMRDSTPAPRCWCTPNHRADVIALADVVGSTIAAPQGRAELDAQEFIVATDNGMMHKCAR